MNLSTFLLIVLLLSWLFCPYKSGTFYFFLLKTLNFNGHNQQLKACKFKTILKKKILQLLTKPNFGPSPLANLEDWSDQFCSTALLANREDTDIQFYIGTLALPNTLLMWTHQWARITGRDSGPYFHLLNPKHDCNSFPVDIFLLAF